ncbi:glycoside hydrolase family 43 protein [Plantactinospora sp. WMMB334]|uniref:glycoside hydrolase family 43 protein n=1 Tax=Plantactinospora sp. WMMB334 TaxID=3404119 RepID=UPI003B941547
MKLWKARTTTRLRLLVAMAGAVALTLGGLALPQPASGATTLIYTTFKGDGAADQELWVYQSTNGGTSYSVLHDTNFRGPTGVLRDPSILKRGSTYYVAYTWQSWTTNSTYFAVARSTDLRNWTNIATVPSGIASTRNVWAPEFYVEGSTVRVIVSVRQTTNSSGFRPYVYTAQNADLTSWSGPQQMGGLGYNYIDTYVVKSGNTYHAFTKNESTKYIERWTSNSLTGGWARQGTLWSSGYEGPSLVRLDNGQYRIYVDKYTNGGIWTATSANLSSWTGLSSVGCSGCRHGTAIPR